MLTIMLVNTSFDEAKDNISYFMKGDFLLGENIGKRAVWGGDEHNCLITLRKVAETRQEICLDLYQRKRPDEGMQRIWFGLVAFLQTIKLTTDSTSTEDWEHIQSDDELHSIINEVLPDETQWKKSFKSGFPNNIIDDGAVDREAEVRWQIEVGRAQRRQDQARSELIARLEKFLLSQKDVAAQWLAEEAQPGYPSPRLSEIIAPDDPVDLRGHLEGRDD